MDKRTFLVKGQAITSPVINFFVRDRRWRSWAGGFRARLAQVEIGPPALTCRAQAWLGRTVRLVWIERKVRKYGFCFFGGEL